MDNRARSQRSGGSGNEGTVEKVGDLFNKRAIFSVAERKMAGVQESAKHVQQLSWLYCRKCFPGKDLRYLTSEVVGHHPVFVFNNSLKRRGCWDERPLRVWRAGPYGQHNRLFQGCAAAALGYRGRYAARRYRQQSILWRRQSYVAFVLFGGRYQHVHLGR